MKKTPKVDQKLRVGGTTQIEHGAKGGGIGSHSMSDNVEHVNMVPTDAGQFDQHHGSGDCEGE